MAAVFSWSDVLQIKELGTLREIFIGHEGELDEKTFVRELRAVLSPEASSGVSSEALSHLFMKIDANSDGTVSWDEFVSFLFLSNAEHRNSTSDDRDEKKVVRLGVTQPKEDYHNEMPHHNSAVTVLIKVDGHPEQHEREIEKSVRSKDINGTAEARDIDSGNMNGRNGDRSPESSSAAVSDDAEKAKEEEHEAADTRGDLYLTGGTDGQLLAWDSHTLGYHNTIDVNLDWIMDAAHLTHTSRLVVTTASRAHVYEVFKDRKKLLQARKVGTVPPAILNNAAAVSVHYRLEPGTQNEWVFFGGDDGGMTCFIFLDSKNNSKAGHAYFDPLLVPAHLSFEDYVDLRRINKLHDDHITQMYFVEELGCLLSSSLDGTLKLTQMDDAGRAKKSYSRRRIKYTFRGHTKAVRSFAWCRSIRMVASCGQERSIKVWAPYSTVHAELVGHQASVIQVVSISGKSRLASLDVESGMRIWDVRTLTCLQNIRISEQPTSLPDSRSSMDTIRRMAFDDDSAVLVTSSHKLACWSPAQDDEDGTDTRLAVHDRVPLSCVLWNHGFRQVVTASHNGRIVVWDVETGRRVFWFTAYDGDGGQANTASMKSDDGVGDVADGDAASSSVHVHGKPMHITSITFDEHGRRLLVGSHEGDAVRIYNFSNGKLLGVLGKVKEEKMTPTTAVGANSISSSGSNSGNSTRVIQESSLAQKKISSSVGNESHVVINMLSASARCAHRRMRTRKRMEMKRSGALRKDLQLRSRVTQKMPEEKALPLVVKVQKKSEKSRKQKPSGSRRISLTFTKSKHLNLRKNCHEISCVVYAMTSPPSSSTIRYARNVSKIPLILCTGWDRRIHAWKERDQTEAGEGHIQAYSKRIPESDAALRSTLHHSDDVTGLCFCPPETIVTAGYGGMVIGWHVHSGAARFRNKFEHPVESMCWMGDEAGYLAVGRSNGQIAIFDVKGGYMLQDCDGPFPEEDDTTLLSVLASDPRGEYIMCGDSVGCIHVFTTVSGNIGGGWLQLFASFQAHDERVTSIAHVEHALATETFLLSASLDGTAAMWTLDGAAVGVFGQISPWSIHDRRTWTQQGESNNLVSHQHQKQHPRVNEKRNRRRKRNPRGGHPANYNSSSGTSSSPNQTDRAAKVKQVRRGARRGTMQMLEGMAGPGGILSVANPVVDGTGDMRTVEDDKSQDLDGNAVVADMSSGVENDVDAEIFEPAVGKVWSRYDHESETYSSVVTIMRVDRQSNLVIGYDGMVDPRTLKEPKMIELELAKMLSQRKRTVRNKVVWRVEHNLTGCVGRLYEDRNAYEPFKVLFLFLSVGTSSPFNPDWWVIDTEKKAHRLPKGDLSLAPRSLTMFKHIQKQEQRRKQMIEQMASTQSSAESDSSGSNSGELHSSDSEKGEIGGGGGGGGGADWEGKRRNTHSSTDSGDATVARTMSNSRESVAAATPGESLIASPVRRRGRQGRRSSLDFLPAKQQLKVYHAKICENTSLPPPIPAVPVRPPGTGTERCGLSRHGRYAAAHSSNVAQQHVERAAEGSYVRLMKARAETRNRAKVKDARKIHGPRGIPIEWTGQVTLIEPVSKGAVDARDFARQLMGLGKESGAIALTGGGGGADSGKRRKGKVSKASALSKEDVPRGKKVSLGLEDRLKIMEKQLAARNW